jgi:hypothetical protein
LLLILSYCTIAIPITFTTHIIIMLRVRSFPTR